MSDEKELTFDNAISEAENVLHTFLAACAETGASSAQAIIPFVAKDYKRFKVVINYNDDNV